MSARLHVIPVDGGQPAGIGVLGEAALMHQVGGDEEAMHKGEPRRTLEEAHGEGVEAEAALSVEPGLQSRVG